MATNPVLQAVMLFHHHQITTPFAGRPLTALGQDAAKPKEEKDPKVPPFDTVEEEDVEEEEEESENKEQKEKENG
jgi:hypothetical protein